MLAFVVGVRELSNSKGAGEERRGRVECKDPPFFSLIVPVKDEERVIGRLLDVLMKTVYPSDKYEVVVVDDASQDGTLKICRKFEDFYPGRIKYLRREASNGKPSALNYALKFAEGDIIGVLDADNVPEPDFLVKTARQFDDKTVVAVQGLLSSINAEENLLTKFLHYEGILQYNALYRGKEKLGLFVPFAGTCMFVRREILEDIGGWRDDALSEDLELSAKLTKKGYRVKFTPEVRSRQENPSRFRELVGQRIRWYRGCLEVALEYGRLLKRLNRRSVDAEIFFFGPFLMVMTLMTFVLGCSSILEPLRLGTYGLFLTRSMSLLTLLTLFIVGVGLAYTTKPRRLSNVKWLPFVYLYWTTQLFVAFYVLLQIVFRRPKNWRSTSKSGVVTD